MNLNSDKYPWLVQLTLTTIDGDTAFCTGSLITLKHVLTARHCFDFPYSNKLYYKSGVAIMGTNDISKTGNNAQTVPILKVSKIVQVLSKYLIFLINF